MKFFSRLNKKNDLLKHGSVVKLVCGFTLLEAVLYLAIAGTVLYFISGFAFNAIFGKSKIETIQAINENTQSVLNKMSSAVGDSLGINGLVSSSTSE